jgi:hypothetical protein
LCEEELEELLQRKIEEKQNEQKQTSESDDNE